MWIRIYKGDLKQFVIERIANKCIDEFYKIDENINWNLYKDLFVEYIYSYKAAGFLSSNPD